MYKFFFVLCVSSPSGSQLTSPSAVYTQHGQHCLLQRPLNFSTLCDRDAAYAGNFTDKKKRAVCCVVIYIYKTSDWIHRIDSDERIDPDDHLSTDSIILVHRL